MIRLVAMAAAAVALTFTCAEADTLTGDTITQTDPTGVHTIVVGAGTDLTEGITFFDYNAGANGNEFVVNTGGGGAGVYSSAGLSTITLSGLNFSGGGQLTGFTLLSSFSPTIVSILSPSSLSLTFSEAPVKSAEVLFDGLFITSSPVPGPIVGAGLPGVVMAIGGFLGLRRRRKTVVA